MRVHSTDRTLEEELWRFIAEIARELRLDATDPTSIATNVKLLTHAARCFNLPS